MPTADRDPILAAARRELRPGARFTRDEMIAYAARLAREVAARALDAGADEAGGPYQAPTTARRLREMAAALRAGKGGEWVEEREGR